MLPVLTKIFKIFRLHSEPSEILGTPGGIRTPDLRIRSPLLYPTELQALVS